MCASPRETCVGSIQSLLGVRAGISWGRARKNCRRKAPQTLRPDWWMVIANGTAVNMRGRFLRSINAWYIKRNARARIASVVNKPNAIRQNRTIVGDGPDPQLPEEMPKAKGGQKKRRLTRGFPIWAFNPRAGRNSRPLPRKFSSARRMTGKLSLQLKVYPSEALKKSMTPIVPP